MTNPGINWDKPIADNIEAHVEYACGKHPSFPTEKADVGILLIDELGEVAEVFDDLREGKVSDEQFNKQIATESLDTIAVIIRYLGTGKDIKEQITHAINLCRTEWHNYKGETDLKALLTYAVKEAIDFSIATYSDYDFEILSCMLACIRMIEIVSDKQEDKLLEQPTLF